MLPIPDSPTDKQQWALHLDPPRPTYPPTINIAPDQAQVVESPYRGGNYINAKIAPMYTTADIEASLSEEGADLPISSLL